MGSTLRNYKHLTLKRSNNQWTIEKIPFCMYACMLINCQQDGY